MTPRRENPEVIGDDGGMSAPLAGHIAVVTGASRGIGRALALHLARHGIAVAALARSSEHLTSLEQVAGSEDLRLLPVAVDVTVPAQVEAAFNVVEAELGAVSLAIACAGTAEALGPVAEADPELWWQAVGVDLRGTMLTARSALQRMRRQRAGRLVTVYGNLGDRGAASVSAFAVAKAGIARLTETLANEVQDCGVGVFCMHPGFVRTSMTERLAWSGEGRASLPTFAEGVESRWGDAQGACDLAAAIATGAADQLTGRVLYAGDDLGQLSERVNTDPDLRRLRIALQ